MRIHWPAQHQWHQLQRHRRELFQPVCVHSYYKMRGCAISQAIGAGTVKATAATMMLAQAGLLEGSLEGELHRCFIILYPQTVKYKNKIKTSSTSKSAKFWRSKKWSTMSIAKDREAQKPTACIRIYFFFCAASEDMVWEGSCTKAKVTFIQLGETMHCVAPHK